MKILHYPDPVLKTKTPDVESFDSDLKEIIENMVPVMKELDGVGLAANQVGILKNIFIVQIPKKELLVAVNPRIISFSDEEFLMEEGCLSLPGVYIEIARPKTVTLEAYDAEGNKFVLEGKNLLARAFCHETEHLKGKVILDHLDFDERLKFETQLSSRKIF
ncbi:peptide deformylase [candidate division WOR-3 bacterium]|nr:peptide deformylase [candidate division WOR-3 bacterium]